MAENFMRSAKPPITSAGVITAKVSWNMTNTVSGIVPASESRVTPIKNSLLGAPISPLTPPPDPMAHRHVDESQPQRRKPEHGRELHALSEAADHQRRRDHGEG